MSELALNHLSIELLATVSRLERQLTELKRAVDGMRPDQSPDASLVPLKRAAGQTGFNAETIRLWITRGLVRGERRGGRWFVDPLSLADRIRTRSPQAA